MINKSKVENFIVLRPGVAQLGDGLRLYNFVTDAINVGIGGIGVFTEFVGSGNHEALDAAAITAGVTTTGATGIPYIQFIQHRDTAGDRTPLYQKTLEQSPRISGTCTVRAVGRGATTKQNSSWIVGAEAGTIGEVAINDETEYILNGALRGWRIDLYNGNNTPFKQGRFTTPDYFASTLYTLDAQRRDHLLQHIVFDFNTQKTQMASEMVAFCVVFDPTNSVTPIVPAAANNVITFTTALALTAGDVIVIGFTDDGQPIRLTVDADLIQTLTAMVASGLVVAASQIVPYARPTAANTAVAGRIIAGGTAVGVADAEVDQVIVLALDMAEAFYDEVSQTKHRVQVGLESGFGATAASEMLTGPSEGSGYAEEVLQYYRDTHGHRQYPGGKAWQQMHVEFPNEIVAGSIYDMYIVESCANRVASSGMPSFSPQKTIIAVQNFETAGFVGFTGGVNPQKTFVEGVINAFMATTIYPHTVIAV